MTSAQKWKLKKQRGSDTTSNGINDTTSSGSGEAGGSGGDMQRMLRLTDLANTIVTSGNMDVYSETYEMITVKVSGVYSLHNDGLFFIFSYFMSVSFPVYCCLSDRIVKPVCLVCWR